MTWEPKSERDKFLTPRECGLLLTHAKESGSPRDYFLVLLGMNLGLRVGELVRLRLEDFNRGDHRVRVATLKRLSQSQKAEKGRAKKVSQRWRKPPVLRGERPRLILEVDLADSIFSQVELYAEEERLSGWLFPSPKDAHHLSVRQAQRIFKRLATEIGISGRTSIHALRHSRGTHLMEKGLSMAEVAYFLRHESEASAAHYRHLMPSRRDAMAEKVGTLGVEDVVK